MKRRILLDCSLLFLLTAALIAPLFRVSYLDHWRSTDGAIVTNARYLQDHFPHPKWQPLWYGGMRFDHLQPPAAVFGTALTAKVLRVSPAQAFHIFTGTLYCAGVAGVYFLVMIWSGRRLTAWLSAAGYAVLSPVFAFFPVYLDDSLLGMPLRLNYLLKWGDGPHICGLAIVPFALGFLYVALQRRSKGALLACAVASAFVVSASLYAGAALIVLSAIAAWAVALGERDRSIWARCGIIAALTYGLCAWWLTPSFLSLSIANLSLITAPGNAASRWIGVAIVIAFLLAAWRLAGRFPARSWSVFLSAAIVVFLLVVIGSKWFGFRILGEPMRLLPELDLLLIIPLAEAVRWISTIRRRFAVAAILLTMCVLPGYLLDPWSVFPAEPNVNARVERRLSDWMAQNLPGSRAFTTGSVRFWYAAWRDVAEITGGSDQAVPTQLRALTQWQVNTSDEDRDLTRNIAWAVATGTDAIIAHENPSQDPLRQMRNPRKYMGRFPVIYDQGGDIVYRVPRRYPGLARVVNEARMQSLAPIPWADADHAEVGAYAAAVEDSGTQVGYERISNTEIRLHARVAVGESILVLETWDPGWTAYEGAAKLPIVRDSMDFIRIQTSPGDHEIRLVYEWPVESRVGQSITAVSLLALFAAAGKLLAKPRRLLAKLG